MAVGYLQIIQQLPDCSNGKMYIYLANTTDLATLYDPISGDEITNPVDIDKDGYVQGFMVDTDIVFDIDAKDYLGASQLTRENVSVIGSSGGLPGTDGKSVYLTVNPDGSATIYDDDGHTTTITSGTDGDDGVNGTNGTNGTDGTNGTNGTNGVSLVSIRVDNTSTNAPVYYTLSSSPTEVYAGDIFPVAVITGQVKVNDVDTADYLNTKILGTTAVAVNEVNNKLEVDLSQVTKDTLTTNTADITALDVRVTALESVTPLAEMHFGGTLGATTVVIPHTLNTDNLFVTCYNTIDNSVIYESIIVTASQISISNLAPLEATNQIKVVLMRAPIGV